MKKIPLLIASIVLLGAGCLRRQPPSSTPLPLSPPPGGGATVGVSPSATQEFPDELNEALNDLELLDDVE